MVDAIWPTSAAAADGCFSSASAEAPATARTPSTTSASSAGFEAYAPTDNVSELTARTNDEGWDTVFAAWLAGSRLRPEDGSVRAVRRWRQPGEEHQPQLGAGAGLRQSVGAAIVGIVGRDGGYTARVADACVVVPTVNPETVTPHSEAFQAVVWHLLVSHPRLKTAATKWESTS